MTSLPTKNKRLKKMKLIYKILIKSRRPSLEKNPLPTEILYIYYYATIRKTIW